MIKTMRRPLVAAVGFLALVGVAASATHYLYEPYNPGFLEYPTIVALHVVLGDVYLALAPFQFVRRIRSRHLGYPLGRKGAGLDRPGGSDGPVHEIGHPLLGLDRKGVHRSLRDLLSLGPDQGLRPHPRQADGLHREWMIRAFAIALAVATMRLIFIPAFIVVADPTQQQLQTLSAAAFLVAFVVHASVAEIWIRLTRRRGVPRVSGTETAYDPTPDSG
jgi:hypothetical protein